SAGKPEEAARLFEQACRLRPEDYQAPNLLASVYTGLGRPAEAEAADRRAVQLAEKHLQLHPDDARALYLGGGALCRLGDPARGLEGAQRALALGQEEPVTLYNVACLYALQGQPEPALDCLEKAVKHGFAHKEWIEHDSDLLSLHSHSRFQELLKGL